MAKKRGTGHSGNPLTSPRLRKTLSALRAAGRRGLTTHQIHKATGSLKPSSDVWALRDRGIPVDSQFERVTRNGSRVFRFTLRAT